MWNILYCSSSPFLGKPLFVYTQPVLGVSDTYREQHIFIYSVLCYWFCRLINHAGVAACPSVTLDHLAEADGAPHPRRSGRQPEPLPKTKWPQGVTGGTLSLESCTVGLAASRWAQHTGLLFPAGIAGPSSASFLS